MRTGRKIRASFSDNTIDISLPESWSDLTQEELAEIYRLKASSLPGILTSVRVFLYLSGLKVLYSLDGDFVCEVMLDDGSTRKLLVKPIDITGALRKLKFIYEPGDQAVRLESLHGHAAVDAELHGVCFGDYIFIENCYQGFISSQSVKTLIPIARKLYPGLEVDSLSVPEQINVLNWLVQLKTVFSLAFPHFFRPVDKTGEGDSMSPLDIMNNEIRILTGGDVTKERDILASDCWRALTELDFKAKEATEHRERMNKK